MPVIFDADEFESVLSQFKQPRSATAPIQASANALSIDEWHQSEAFQVRIITARTKLKLMRDRSDALRDSLQRFQRQQHSVKRA